MRVLDYFTAALLLVAFASAAQAAPGVYGEAFNELYRIDLTGPHATDIGDAGYIGNQPIADITGLGYGPDGRLYAASDTIKALLTIDTTSGAATVIGAFGLVGQGDPQHDDALDFGMSFDCDDNLWLSSATTGKLWRVDRHSGAAAFVGNLGHTITGLAARNDVLYGAGGRGDNALYRIDRSNGHATAIGGFGAQLNMYVNSVALGFDADGTLWAAINYNPPATDEGPFSKWSDLATIDPDTGNVTLIGPITGPSQLQYVGMKGLVVGPLQCNAPTGGVPPDATAELPVRSLWALGLLVVLLGTLGAFGTSRRRSGLTRFD
ncbi:MAG: hypothetical protein WBW61_03030 [Rhodanobacteraceae bacterium]